MNFVPTHLLEAEETFQPCDYKSDLKPVWCPGCGDHAVLLAFQRAMAELALPPEKVAVVSGIGCSSRIPAYTNTYGFHGVHGRALPIATGLKVARPDLTVIVASGDGDGFSIGGNHFLHACRRNVDLTYIVMDNRIYGMTKGQPSPTTEPDWETALTPGGSGLLPFHAPLVALASGANFIGRTSSGNVDHCARMIVEAIRTPGFSFLQILSPCVTFRPDQRQAWKGVFRDHVLPEANDPGLAARHFIEDDGFNIGVLYRASRQCYAPAPQEDLDPAVLEEEFAG